MAEYLLVSFKTCPWVQRAAIVLREKNVDFEFRHIEHPCQDSREVCKFLRVGLRERLVRAHPPLYAVDNGECVGRLVRRESGGHPHVAREVERGLGETAFCRTALCSRASRTHDASRVLSPA
jgi:hypothetical protein